jgi:hypothetical protein
VQTPSLNIVSADVLHVLGDSLTGENTLVVRSLREVRQALDAYGARPPAPAVSVDLHGHSTRDHRLLRLGETVIDALDPLVRRFFEEVERSQVLAAMNAVSLRLLGCETGVSPSGQRTLRMLAEILGLPCSARASASRRPTTRSKASIRCSTECSPDRR